MCPSGEDGVDFHLAATDGPDIDWQGDVKVVELEPVLDLLERSRGGVAVAGILNGREIIEFLREHGRLEET